MSKTKLHDSPIAFEVQGSGPNLVLFHGFGGSHTHWNKLLPELAKNYRVILPNLGPLTLGSMKLTFGEQVEMLGDFKRAIKKEFGSFSIVGISYGGALGWALASCDDEMTIDRLILINPMPPYPISNMKSRSLKRLFFFGRWAPLLAIYLLTPIAHWDFHSVGSDIRVDWANKGTSFTKIYSRKQKMLFHMIERFSWILHNEDWAVWQNQIGKIEKPVRVIHGTLDRIFSLKTMDVILRKLKFGDLKLANQGTHLAIHSAPKDVLNFIKEFLGALRAS